MSRTRQNGSSNPHQRFRGERFHLHNRENPYLFRDTLNAMHKAEPSEMARDVLLDAILDDGTASRVILSDANFFRSPATALQEGVLYPAAAVRMLRMAQLFPEDEIRIFMAIRNPASLVPVLYEKAADKTSAAFWGERGPEDLRWSETIGQLREAAPGIPITLWCNEDAPLIWAQIIREMAGLAPETKIKGGFDLLQTIMSEEGMKRFRGYLDTHPDMSEAQKRRVITAFLDKYALDDAIEARATKARICPTPLIMPGTKRQPRMKPA